ncbi:MAG: SDR family oxidoreductase [Burkholderiaceae bacterium]
MQWAMDHRPERVVLVIGGTGLTGRYLLQHITRHRPDWQTIGVARRAPDFVSGARFLQADLGSPEAARASLSGLSSVTDLVYAGFVQAPSFTEQLAPNLALLANTLDGLAAARCPLRRVVLIQGMKYYGSHLGAFKTPAREDDPRHLGINYYYAQQDLLLARQAHGHWHSTLLRPHVICGHGVTSTQNLLTVVGVFAALARAANVPLRFPGSRAAFGAINQATDARLLARAIIWALEDDRCANQAYNITNGDHFRWENLWPAIAAHFGLDPGPVQTLDLATHMPPLAPAWEALARHHSLRESRLDRLVHWPFADYILRTGHDVMSNTVKARQHGFADCIDTEAMFIELLTQLQRGRILP